ncbi:type II secretory pathway pseudopilin PulG [Pseudomonas lini]|uniref:lysis system i-spanin subunit Rz n=1 Tax=Pseudomonas lini TaxID=163011 RepID=UPI002788A1A2|nr:lysis system i-spanin subunit Rz [Pseudomonas lini]MDQ0124252.1 type II secretory pathway pseudopilin PulG [Pseudomonas lini]
MRLIDWIPVGYRAGVLVLALVLLAGLSAGGAWQVQDWRYAQVLAKEAKKTAEQYSQGLAAVVGQLEQQKTDSRALEARLKTNDESHYQELQREQAHQKRLRDRLATGELRLSVLLASGYAASGGGPVSAATGPGGVVHGTARADLEPAHAQRIIGITDDGDAGLIALAACQAYAKEVSTPK